MRKTNPSNGIQWSIATRLDARWKGHRVDLNSENRAKGQSFKNSATKKKPGISMSGEHWPRSVFVGALWKDEMIMTILQEWHDEGYKIKCWIFTIGHLNLGIVHKSPSCHKRNGCVRDSFNKIRSNFILFAWRSGKDVWNNMRSFMYGRYSNFLQIHFYSDLIHLLYGIIYYQVSSSDQRLRWKQNRIRLSWFRVSSVCYAKVAENFW